MAVFPAPGAPVMMNLFMSSDSEYWDQADLPTYRMANGRL
jgi:hypothetical protein